MKKLIKILFLFFTLCLVVCSRAFAREADHIKLLPDFKDAAFDAGNLYFGLEGIFALPVAFTGDQKIAGIGAGAAFEAGYDLDGWLLGFHGEWRFNSDNGNYMKEFKNIFLEAEISKLFVLVPDFLEVRARVGAGADFINTVFYPNELYKNIGKTVKESSAAMIYSAGANLEFAGIKLVIPYIGTDVIFSGDTDGLFLHTSLNLGLRTTVRRLCWSNKKENISSDK